MAVEQVVDASYDKLADSISKEIRSIRKQISQSTQEEDNPMSPQDQWNDNFVDDDESEEHNGNHWQNWKNQCRNNHHKQQQMMDDEEEDESANGPVHGTRKTLMIFSVCNYLPQFSHESTNTDIVCTLCISLMQGADG